MHSLCYIVTSEHLKFSKIKSLKHGTEEGKIQVGTPIQRQVLEDPLGFARSLNQRVREEKRKKQV